jgi:hypothetical protein
MRRSPALRGGDVRVPAQIESEFLDLTRERRQPRHLALRQ